MPQTLKCPSCAAPLEYDGRNPTLQCAYCNNIVLMPETARSRPSAVEAPADRLSPDSISALPPDLAAELNDLIRRGLKIAAIKRYRESYNVGLKEAKDAVDALESGRPTPQASQPTTPALILGTADLPLNRLVEINDLMQRGRKIEAIKLFRETFNVGLKEAKDAVESLEKGEMISLVGGQTITVYAGETADINQAGLSMSAAGRPAGTVPAQRPGPKKAGFLGPFLGQWGCLMFGFFWVAFLLVMVGTLIFPGTVLATAPVLCHDGYQSATAERVSYYSTGNFEGNNIILLHCQVGDGQDITPHPMAVSSLLCGGYLAFFGVLSFIILLVRKIPAILKM
jgi:ribosomal protein L7/L12